MEIKRIYEVMEQSQSFQNQTKRMFVQLINGQIQLNC